MTHHKSLIPLFFFTICLACNTNGEKESIDYGTAKISNARQEINAREHHNFTCEKRTEENPFGNFTELELDENELRFTNIESSLFEGRTINFKINKMLNISEVSYNEWIDVIHNDRTEKYKVVESGINLNIDPFKTEGQELVADYYLKVKHTTDFKWSWNKDVNYFIVTGRFKCNKNMW
ncbi:hypothetical protein SB49_10830 [Sediminicola sp. YIK13]|uniref:hypothetical protein n=1 Tax=Sediminicola sp. YIK13 TaxID=1453352 RepID=UPI0007202377|nr:hypothetical protein [Sediminicola sp. YIK13]ALM08240.1 hypothetical protein SB49_10830 [Sediminicola sp. YIK13]